jgi:acylphosphatase
MIRYHIFFSGRVQRVGFRFFVVKCAELYGISGYVKNLPDGRVEAEIQGKSEQITAFLARVQEGNGVSKVSDISKQEVKVKMEESGFIIR